VFKVFGAIGVGEGHVPPLPRLEVILADLEHSGKFENVRTNLKMKTFFRNHTNPMRKKGKILVKTLFLGE